MKRNSGFTLIEVLIAMAITVVVAAIAYSGLDAAMKMAQTSEQKNKDLQNLSRSVDIIVTDLRHAQARMVRSSMGQGQFNSAMVYDENAFPQWVFTRTGRINPQPKKFQRSHLERVAYLYEKQTLSRIRWPMPDFYSDDEGDKIQLLENVTAFSVRFYRLNNSVAYGSSVDDLLSQNKGRWVEAWPSEGYSGPGVNVLPLAVEVTIEHKQYGTITRLVELVGTPADV